MAQYQLAMFLLLMAEWPEPLLPTAVVDMSDGAAGSAAVADAAASALPSTVYRGMCQAYDPVMTSTDHAVLAHFRIALPSSNEEGRHVVAAEGASIVFLPHCANALIHNLFAVNWTPAALSRMVVIGNSFDHYQSKLNLAGGPPVQCSSIHFMATSHHTMALAFLLPPPSSHIVSCFVAL